MVMKIVFKLSITYILVVFAYSVFSQFQGTGSLDKIYTVKEIKANASKLDRADQQVKVKGYIVKHINKNDYLFQDATGSMRVELKKKYMPDQPFDDKTELILIGEIDHDLLDGVELEVEELAVVVKK